MEEQEYRTMFLNEDTHWWYLGLRELVLREVRKALGKSELAVLDAGCGTGAVLERISGDSKSFGIDYSPSSLSLCRERGLKRLARATVTELPFGQETFDIVISLDVICCTEVVDDVKALNEFRRVLKKGGVLILNLPAFEFLRASHDKAVHIGTRYTTGGLGRKLRDAGLEPVKLTYRNTFLFPAVAGVKLFKRHFRDSGEAGASDLSRTPDILNRLLSTVLSVENLALGSISMPFGTSVFCVARKRG